MKRESLNTPIRSPHFESRSGRLSHTGGTYSHSGMVDYPRASFAELNLGTFLYPMEFQRWKTNFRAGDCLKTADPQFTVLWSEEVEIAKSTDELLTSRSIVEKDFLGCDDRVCIEDSQHAGTVPKKSKCRRAASSKIRPILTRKTNCVHDLRVFPCDWSLCNSTKTRRLVHYEFAE